MFLVSNCYPVYKSRKCCCILDSKAHKSLFKGSQMAVINSSGLVFLVVVCVARRPKTPKLKHGTKLKTTTHEGTQTHPSFSAVPAVDVESILQGECERTVRDVGVGSARRGLWRGHIHRWLWLCGQVYFFTPARLATHCVKYVWMLDCQFLRVTSSNIKWMVLEVLRIWPQSKCVVCL